MLVEKRSLSNCASKSRVDVLDEAVDVAVVVVVLVVTELALELMVRTDRHRDC